MSDQFHIVPWYNSAEWLEVYNTLFSQDSNNKQHALKVLQMWKSRCLSLPSGVESTLSLLQVNLEDLNNINNIAPTSQETIRLAYCSALMRFVNHMLDTETAKGASLYNAAKNLGLPDWIIDLRHDIAHSNNLPSIYLLRCANVVGLEWIKKNYWDKHKECIHDYVAGQEVINNCNENKVATLINFCGYLSVCCHSKIKNLAEISDISIQKAIMDDAKFLFVDAIDLSNLNVVTIGDLIKLSNTHAKKILNVRNVTATAIKHLLSDESIVMSLELVEHLSKNDFENKHKLSRCYVECFEFMLSFLHTYDLLFDFVVALIQLTQCNENNCPRKALLAALWLSEILSALRKCKQFIKRSSKIKGPYREKYSRNHLIMLYHHWFPSEKLDLIIFDFQKPVPWKLTDIKFIKPIISTYNPYLTYFIKELLLLVEPELPKQTIENICELSKVISCAESNPSNLSKQIYTIEDLKSNDNMTDDEEMLVESNNPNEMNGTQEGRQSDIGGIWKMSSVNLWQSCPIGMLPWECNG